MKKQWRVVYFGCMGGVVKTGKLTKRSALKFFKTYHDAICLEKVEGRRQRQIFKDDIE